MSYFRYFIVGFRAIYAGGAYALGGSVIVQYKEYHWTTKVRQSAFFSFFSVYKVLAGLARLTWNLRLMFHSPTNL